jgi:uncharacterized protein involved in exopolysaccharide biosynthesis
MDDPNVNHNEFQKTDSLLNFLNVIFKRGRIILTFFLSVVGLVTAVSFFMTPVYKASSKILVERELDSEKALLFQMGDQSGYERFNWIFSEMEIINSHPVALQQVAEFDLDELDQKKEPASELERAERFDQAVESFKENLVVDSGSESNVLTVSYENKDPNLAKAVVENVIATYLEQRSKISSESDEYDFFVDQMGIADDNLRELEQREAEYKQLEQVISPDAQKEILLARLADYEQSLTEVKMKRIAKEASLYVIKKHLKDGSTGSIPVTESSDSPSRERYIAKLKGELLDLELQREFLLQKYTPQYKEVVYLDNQIKTTRGKIKNEIDEIVSMEEISIRALKAEEMVLRASITKINKEIQDFAKKEYELTQLSRGIDENKEVYSMFLRQREEARISLAKNERGVKVSVISPPFVLPDPVRPQKKFNVILAVLIGLIGGLGLAFVIEYFDHSISNSADLEKYTGMNVLGSVREIEAAKGEELTVTGIMYSVTL